jgi:endonuclease YncB( thermonuclease family)
MVGICLWSLVCAQAYASIYEGKVVGVSDGDMLTVLISGRQTKVRLAEIDAPDKRQPVPTQANCVNHRFPCQLKQVQFSKYSTLFAVLIVRL